jgi:stage III sporulation protein SpoIIIAA
LDELLAVLPNGLARSIAPEARPDLVEIVLDLGRRPEARFVDRYEYLREEVVTREELHWVEERLGAFGTDNRAGIPATLHRISAMRNRRGEVVGLTLRIGRAVMGIVDIVRDIIESGESVLLMGRPGLGKTTLLREMARVLADEVGKRVVIVDTSNEIAGDGDVPHPAIGRARRMQVARVEQQHDVMIEAVENHMPEVVVIDEIGRIEEALAARTIAERGVQLVATVHGNTLDNLLANPSMSDLIGGIQAVTLSDEEARRRRTQKTVLERKAPPTFDVVVEMVERDRVSVRRPVGEVVDALLRGMDVPPEIRWRDENGDIQVERAKMPPAPQASHDFEMRGSGGRGNFDSRGPRRGEGRSDNRNERRGSRRDRRDIGRDTRDDDAYGADFWPRSAGNNRISNAAPSGRNGLSGAAARPHDAYEQALLDTVVDAGALTEEEEASLADYVEPEAPEGEAEKLGTPRLRADAPMDVSRVRNLYPFGVSRSRLGRAIKHLGLPVGVARTWKEADAVLMLTGPDGVAMDSSLLRAPREMGLPIIAVEGNTYAHILTRLNDLYAQQLGEGTHSSPRDMAMKEAQNAVQRVLAEAEPVELRPQGKPVRRMQHQLAQRFHLRSYSVGREPNRRVRFLPSIGR